MTNIRTFQNLISSSYSNDEREKIIIDLYSDFLGEKLFDFHYTVFPQKCIESIKTRKNDSDKCITFERMHDLLDVYERKFIKSGDKERYAKVYYQIYYTFYLLYESCHKFDTNQCDFLGESRRLWIQRKWLTICFNSLSDKILRSWLEGGIIDPAKPIDVEETVKIILFDHNNNMRDEFNRKEMSYYASRATDWFLKRYDWKSSFDIKMKKILFSRRRNVGNKTRQSPSEKEEIQNGNKKKGWISNNLWFLLPMILVIAGFIMVYLLSKDYIQYKLPHELNSFAKINEPITRDILRENTQIGVLYHIESFLIGIILSGIIFTYRHIRKKGLDWFKFFLPRLLGAILIGFMPLVGGPEMFTFPLRLNWVQVVGISVILLLIAYYYLMYECYSMAGNKGILLRTLTVIFYGILVSFVISLFICDVTAVDFINYEKAIYISGFKGVFGVLYPKIIVLYAPAALLIGIFIQIFWEEKTITEPL